MGLLHQIGDAVGARVGRVLDRLEDPAETLALARRRQQEMLAEVRQRLDEYAERRARLEAEVARGQVLADQLAGQAEAARSAGADSVAHDTLDRREAVLARLADLGAAHRALAAEEVRLVDVEQGLQDRIAEFAALAETIEAERITDDIRAQVDRAVAEAERMQREEARFEAGL